MHAPNCVTYVTFWSSRFTFSCLSTVAKRPTARFTMQRRALLQASTGLCRREAIFSIRLRCYFFELDLFPDHFSRLHERKK